MIDFRTIRISNRYPGCKWAEGKWFAYQSIGGAAGIVIGNKLITWCR